LLGQGFSGINQLGTPAFSAALQSLPTTSRQIIWKSFSTFVRSVSRAGLAAGASGRMCID
jgi:hypothetical protein